MIRGYTKLVGLLSLFIFVQLHCVLALHKSVPEFTINLDDPPKERWTKVIKTFKSSVPAIVAETNQLVPRRLQPILFGLASLLSHSFPSEIREELQGIAEATGLSLGQVVGINILYDVTAFDRRHILSTAPTLGCTSLVVEQSNGHVLHGRNLDYDFPELLRNITLLANFARNGNVLFSAVTFPLYVGVLTGQRFDAFSVSLNARYTGAYIDNILMAILTRFRHPVSFAIRQTLTDATHFEEALESLATVQLVCPSYIIVAGSGKSEGAIVARDRKGVASIDRLNSDTWYLVETNFDRDKGDHDKRRLTAERYLKKVGRERVDVDAVVQALSQSPTLNNLTIFTAILDPSDEGAVLRRTLQIRHIDKKKKKTTTTRLN